MGLGVYDSMCLENLRVLFYTIIIIKKLRSFTSFLQSNFFIIHRYPAYVFFSIQQWKR